MSMTNELFAFTDEAAAFEVDGQPPLYYIAVLLLLQDGYGLPASSSAPEPFTEMAVAIFSQLSPPTFISSPIHLICPLFFSK